MYIYHKLNVKISRHNEMFCAKNVSQMNRAIDSKMKWLARTKRLKLNENESVSKWITEHKRMRQTNANWFQLTVNSPVIASNPTWTVCSKFCRQTEKQKLSVNLHNLHCLVFVAFDSPLDTIYLVSNRCQVLASIL